MMFDNAPPQHPTESSAESHPSPQTDAITSAFLAAGREVDGPCLNEDIPPYHAPTPDPEGGVSPSQLVDAQLAGAQLVSHALVRSFLRSKYPLDVLTTPPPCIVQWCQETDQPFQNFPPLSSQSLTLAAEWAYDRTLSRLLFDHDYVQKMPIDPFDPQRLVCYLSTTQWNDQRNLARHRSETLRHDESQDNTQDADAPHDMLEETCAAPLPWTQRARLLHDALTEICDLCQVEQTTAEILCRYYLDGATPADIQRTYGVTIEAVRKRLTRALEKDPVCGAQATAAVQELITAMHRTEPVPPRKCTPPEKGEADQDGRRLEPETEGQCEQDVPTLPKKRSTDAKEA
jgi:hypothetical protein